MTLNRPIKRRRGYIPLIVLISLAIFQLLPAISLDLNCIVINKCQTTKHQHKEAIEDKQSNTSTKSPTKNVISFSLYGKNDRYTNGAIENAKLAPEIYPGWQVYIYHDNTVPSATLTELSSIPHVRLFNVSVSLAKTNSMAWRFMVALDPDISAYIIRDIDSRLSKFSMNL